MVLSELIMCSTAIASMCTMWNPQGIKESRAEHRVLVRQFQKGFHLLLTYHADILFHLLHLHAISMNYISKYPHIPLIFLHVPRHLHHSHMHLHLIVSRDHDVLNHLHHILLRLLILLPRFSSLLHQLPNHFHLYPLTPQLFIHQHLHHCVLVLDCLHIATNHRILLDYLNLAGVAPIS